MCAILNVYNDNNKYNTYIIIDFCIIRKDDVNQSPMLTDVNSMLYTFLNNKCIKYTYISDTFVSAYAILF